MVFTVYPAYFSSHGSSRAGCFSPKTAICASKKILSFCFDQFEQTGLNNDAIVSAMKEFKNILLVVDPRTSSDSQMNRALTFASSKNAKITIAAVVESGVNTPGLVDIIVEIQEKLDKLRGKMQDPTSRDSTGAPRWNLAKHPRHPFPTGELQHGILPRRSQNSVRRPRQQKPFGV